MQFAAIDDPNEGTRRRQPESCRRRAPPCRGSRGGHFLPRPLPRQHGLRARRRRAHSFRGADCTFSHVNNSRGPGWTSLSRTGHPPRGGADATVSPARPFARAVRGLTVSRAPPTNTVGGAQPPIARRLPAAEGRGGRGIPNHPRSALVGYEATHLGRACCGRPPAWQGALPHAGEHPVGRSARDVPIACRARAGGVTSFRACSVCVWVHTQRVHGVLAGSTQVGQFQRSINKMCAHTIFPHAHARCADSLCPTFRGLNASGGSLDGKRPIQTSEGVSPRWRKEGS